MKKKNHKKQGGGALKSRETITIRNPAKLEWHENILFGIRQIIDPDSAYQQLELNDQEGLYELDNRYDFTSTVITIVISIFCIGLIIVMSYLLYRAVFGPNQETQLSNIFNIIDKKLSPIQSIHNDPSWPDQYFERDPANGTILKNATTNKPLKFNPLDEVKGPIDPNTNLRTPSNWDNFSSKFDELAFIFTQPGGGQKSTEDCMQLRQSGGALPAQNFNIPSNLFGPNNNSAQVINPNWESKKITSIKKINDLTGLKLVEKIKKHFASFTYNKNKYITFKVDKSLPQPSVLFDNIKEVKPRNSFF